MKRARGNAVHVLDVVDDAYAESIEVEMGVARLQRIERPKHSSNASAGKLLALELLEMAPDTGSADTLAHAEHVRPVNRLPIADAGEAEHEANERPGGIERADGEPANTRGHAKQRRRDMVERAPPDLRLQHHTGGRVFGRRERAVGEAGGVGAEVGGVGSASVGVEIERHGRSDRWAGRARERQRTPVSGIPQWSTKTVAIADRSRRPNGPSSAAWLRTGLARTKLGRRVDLGAAAHCAQILPISAAG